jgi:phytoene desaturase
MKNKKIIIIGAGPGGLTAGMLLTHRGFDVTIYEKDNMVGGRNKSIAKNGFKFDVGPTFLMMKFILDEVFLEAGKKIDDYLKCTRLDPMYRLKFKDHTLDLSDNHQKTKQNLKKTFGTSAGFDEFLEREEKRFKVMYPCLQKSYHRISAYLEKEMLQALPRLSLSRTMFSELGKYFKNDDEKIAFTFQSKYLGMSPWECPAAFLIMPYMEHAFGIYHVEGGLSEISQAMAKVFKENGGKLKLKSPVERLIIRQGAVKGVKLENGKEDLADETIINADFSYAMKALAKNKAKKYSVSKLKKKKYSCSTYMLYLGIDRELPLEHHTIVFSKNYKTFVNKIAKEKEVDSDISFYVRNAGKTDKTLAPKGKSALYILVPVPNQKSGINWKKKAKALRKTVLERLAQDLKLRDLEKHIEVEHQITPDEWEADFNIFIGATFNLAHTLDQMLYLRPRNKFEGFENCYLVGGGTHPGSGLPTIYESGRITSNLICRKHGVSFDSYNKYIV